MLTNSNKTNWDSLSMADRTNYIKLGLDNGISDLKVIRDTYNKFADGGNSNTSKQGYIREDLQNPISFDSEGNLTDQVTGEKGMLKLPEVIVTPKRYSSAFDGNFGLTSKDLLSVAPVVGDALDIIDIGRDAYNGDYINAGIGAGLLALPNILEKPLKFIGKKIAKPFINKGITSLKNISSDPAHWLDTQWDALYNKAIKNKDMTEAQRLRDLHFKVKSGDNGILNSEGNPEELYHTVSDRYPSDWNVFDMEYEGSPTMIYTTNNPVMSGSYSSKYSKGIIDDNELNKSRRKKVYGTSQEMYTVDGNHNNWSQIQIPLEGKSIEEAAQIYKDRLNEKAHSILVERGLLNEGEQYNPYDLLFREPNKEFSSLLRLRSANNNQKFNDILKEIASIEIPNNIVSVSTRDIEKKVLPIEGLDAYRVNDIRDYGNILLKHPQEYINGDIRNGVGGDIVVFKNPSQIKYSSPITYDDKGKVIPLSKRDNFNSNDMRYGIAVPLGLVGFGAYEYNNRESKSK